MTWLRVTVTSPSDELTGLLAEGLVACGGSAVEERDGRLISYLASEGDDAASVRCVRDTLRDVADAVELAFEQVPEQDWLALWRTGLAPRRVGPRLVVSPTWCAVDAGTDRIVIRIDPQMAFGTGEHASTRGVLRMMQDVVEPGTSLLDVGSGSAILAIAAAKLGARHVTAAESDEDAMPNAAENVDRNEVADRVTLLCERVDDTFLDDFGPGAFHGILANVLSGVLLPLLPAFHHALSPGGWAILSGILLEEADAMRAAAAAAGFTVDAEDVEEVWWSVRLRRVGA